MPIKKGDIVVMGGISYIAREDSPDDVKPPAYPYTVFTETQLTWRGGVTYTLEEVRNASDDMMREILIHLMNLATIDGDRIAELERRLDAMQKGQK